MTNEATGTNRIAGVDPMPGGRRRIDRVLAPDFLTSVGDMDPWPRCASGVTRRSKKRPTCRTYGGCCKDASTSCAPSLDAVPATSGDPWSTSWLRSSPMERRLEPHGLGRHATVEPSRVAEHRRSVEQLVSDAGVSDVVNRTDDELAASLSRLTDYEAAVSRNRRKVQDVMDACTAEIARRYQSGEASVDDLLAGR